MWNCRTESRTKFLTGTIKYMASYRISLKGIADVHRQEVNTNGYRVWALQQAPRKCARH